MQKDLAAAFNDFDPIFEIDKHPEPSLELIEQTLKTLKEKHMPETKMKFNRKKHVIQEFMTKDLMDGIRHRDKLHRKIEQLHDRASQQGLALVEEYKTFSENLRKAIRAAKRDFYHKKFDLLKHSLKNTWKSINFVLNRTRKKSELPCSFLVDGNVVTDKQDIANEMNKFFTNIGPSLASAIDTSNKPDFKSHLSEPPPPISISSILIPRK